MTKMKKLYDLELYRIYKEGINFRFRMNTLCLKCNVTARQLNALYYSNDRIIRSTNMAEIKNK